MPEGRRGFLAGLVLGLVPVAAAARVGSEPDLLVRAQYRYGPPRRRRRCWIERQRIVVTDRFGRPRRRIVERQVCR